MVFLLLISELEKNKLYGDKNEVHEKDAFQQLRRRYETLSVVSTDITYNLLMLA